MILLDSAFLIALVDSREEHHDRAVELYRSFRESLALTELVYSEVLTICKRRWGPAFAKTVTERLAGASNVEMLFLNAETTDRASLVFLKYPNLSFPDAASIAMLKHLGASSIASFDSDFDRVPGVTRVH